MVGLGERSSSGETQKSSNAPVSTNTEGEK